MGNKSSEVAPKLHFPDLNQIEDVKLKRELTLMMESIRDYLNFYVKPSVEDDKKEEKAFKEKTEAFIEDAQTSLNDSVQAANNIFTSFGEQEANLVLASPDGSKGDVRSRALVNNDLPNIDISKLPTNILNSDLTDLHLGAILADGFIVVNDNNGHQVKLLYKT